MKAYKNDGAYDFTTQDSEEITVLCADYEKYKKGYERYEKARKMSVKQWHDATLLSNKTGRSFTSIIDDFKSL